MSIIRAFLWTLMGQYLVTFIHFVLCLYGFQKTNCFNYSEILLNLLPKRT